MSLKLSEVGEFGLIEIIKKMAARSRGVVVGIGDDAAVVDDPAARGSELVLLTTDMLAEGVHFTRKAKPEEIGHKALAASISDIAAMGGRPAYAVVSLGAPGSLNVAFAKGMLKGINRLAKCFRISIVGGDTIKTKRIIINVALLGGVKRQELTKRDGAQEGDVLFVTGPLGGSLKSGKHLKFMPRIKESRFLVKKFKPTSMIDISDGLIKDLKHLCEQSSVGAVLYEKNLPKTKKTSLKQALYDGEDFELLFTLSKKKAKRLETSKTQMKFYRIGEIVHKRKNLVVIDSKGNQIGLKSKGFDHYDGRS